MKFRKMKKIMKKNGFYHDHNRGNHAIFARDGYSVPVPGVRHPNNDMKPGTIKSIFRSIERIVDGIWLPWGMAR